RTRRWTAPFPEPRGHGALTGLVSRISTVALISASTAQAASTAKPALVAWVPAWAAVAPARSDEAAAAAATVPATATPSAAPVWLKVLSRPDPTPDSAGRTWEEPMVYSGTKLLGSPAPMMTSATPAIRAFPVLMTRIPAPASCAAAAQRQSR